MATGRVLGFRGQERIRKKQQERLAGPHMRGREVGAGLRLRGELRGQLREGTRRCSGTFPPWPEARLRINGTDCVGFFFFLSLHVKRMITVTDCFHFRYFLWEKLRSTLLFWAPAAATWTGF